MTVIWYGTRKTNTCEMEVEPEIKTGDLGVLKNVVANILAQVFGRIHKG